MPDFIEAPVRPIDSSLSAHLLALDLLSARLSALPSQTNWPVRVPINSKASFRGDVVHTNDLKVHLGEEWWVEMTAEEAAAYIRRRRRCM